MMPLRETLPSTFQYYSSSHGRMPNSSDFTNFYLPENHSKLTIVNDFAAKYLIPLGDVTSLPSLAFIIKFYP